MTFFDSADAYGDGASETVLGKAFQGQHGEVTIATKAGYRFTERARYEQLLRRGLRGVTRRAPLLLTRASSVAHGPSYATQDFSPEYLTAALDESLRRLRRERIDIYQLHEPPPGAVTDDAMAWLTAAVSAGKVARAGVSLERAEQAEPWFERHEIDSVQLPFGVIDGRAGADALRAAARKGVPVIARSVLASGLLSQRLPEGELRALTPSWRTVLQLRSLADSLEVEVIQLALWYVRARAEVSTYLVGMSSTRHVDSTASMSRTPLPGPEVLADIERIVDGSPDLDPDSPVC